MKQICSAVGCSGRLIAVPAEGQRVETGGFGTRPYEGCTMSGRAHDMRPYRTMPFEKGNTMPGGASRMPRPTTSGPGGGDFSEEVGGYEPFSGSGARGIAGRLEEAAGQYRA